MTPVFGSAASGMSSKSKRQGSGGIERIRDLPSRLPTFAVMIAAVWPEAGAV